jgi:hypothetical protein
MNKKNTARNVIDEYYKRQMEAMQQRLRDALRSNKVDIREDGDGTRRVFVYAEPIPHVVQEKLGLRSNNMWRENHPDSKYRGSGLWSCHRDHGTGELRFSVDVGCWHEHDCCGCACGQHYVVKQVDGVTIVVSDTWYNV